MTNYNKATLAATFSQGAIPQGTDFSNLIYSQVNLVETAPQAMAGSLSTTELDTPLVSAATVNVTTKFTTNNLAITGLTSAKGGINTAIISAASLNATGAIKGSTGSFSSLVSAKNGVSTTTVSATTVNYGTLRTANPSIVSAAGTAQATAAPISSSVSISRLQGVTDGQTTGFLLPTPTGNIGIQQVLNCEAATSCNLWPSVGCKINGLGTNAAFAMAANTPYYVTYVAASAYAVK